MLAATERDREALAAAERVRPRSEAATANALLESVTAALRTAAETVPSGKLRMINNVSETAK